MNEATITKEFRIEAGHRLVHHKGQCSNIHGHSYLIQVSVTGEVDKRTGMVIDYADISRIVRPVLNVWDHAFIVNAEDEVLIRFLETFITQEGKTTKLIILADEPTAENISIELYNQWFDPFMDLELEDLKLQVTVHETARTSAVLR